MSLNRLLKYFLAKSKNQILGVAWPLDTHKKSLTDRLRKSVFRWARLDSVFQQPVRGI